MRPSAGLGMRTCSDLLTFQTSYTPRPRVRNSMDNLKKRGGRWGQWENKGAWGEMEGGWGISGA